MYIPRAIRQQLKERLLKRSISEDTDTIKVEVDGEVVTDTTTSDTAVPQSEETVVPETLGQEPVAEEGPDPIEEPGAPLGISDMLIDAIKDEYETISFYNTLIANANDVGLTVVADIIKHINEEENIHVGMLQYAMTLLSKQASDVSKGTEEAEEIVATGDSDIHDDETTNTSTEDDV